MFGKCFFHKTGFYNVQRFENFRWKSLRKFDAIKISLATTISFDHHHLLSVFVVCFFFLSFSWYEWLLRISIFIRIEYICMRRTLPVFIHLIIIVICLVFALSVIHWLQYHYTYSVQTLCYVFNEHQIWM